MRLFIMIAALTFSFAASASEVTGSIQCAIYDQAGNSAKGSTDLVVEADGTGGVGEASAELGGLKCSASGFSKFGMRFLTGISITVNGLKIESPIERDKVDGLLLVGNGSCVCYIK
ncbi:MAG: hypothetical protein ACK5RO_06445 [Pseudobdellovibrionaceae bacterium]